MLEIRTGLVVCFFFFSSARKVCVAFCLRWRTAERRVESSSWHPRARVPNNNNKFTITRIGQVAAATGTGTSGGSGGRVATHPERHHAVRDTRGRRAEGTRRETPWGAHCAGMFFAAGALGLNGGRVKLSRSALNRRTNYRGVVANHLVRAGGGGVGRCQVTGFRAFNKDARIVA